MALKKFIIDAGFAAFRASGLHKALAPATRGRGVILTFHRVRPWEPATPGFAPNRLLEITPEFLDQALGLTRRLGFEFVALEEARRRLVEGGARFAALTFDDGYRDTRDFALPVLERHGAPFTVFFAPGFIERSARLWWLELEEALRRLDEASIDQAGLALRLRRALSRRKDRRLRADLLGAAGAPGGRASRRGRRAGAQGRRRAAPRSPTRCSWTGTRSPRSPAIRSSRRARTRMTHRMLAKWPEGAAREEMAGSKAALEARLGLRRRAPSPIPSATRPAPVRANSSWRVRSASPWR